MNVLKLHAAVADWRRAWDANRQRQANAWHAASKDAPGRLIACEHLKVLQGEERWLRTRAAELNLIAAELLGGTTDVLPEADELAPSPN